MPLMFRGGRGQDRFFLLHGHRPTARRPRLGRWLCGGDQHVNHLPYARVFEVDVFAHPGERLNGLAGAVVARCDGKL